MSRYTPDMTYPFTTSNGTLVTIYPSAGDHVLWEFSDESYQTVVSVEFSAPVIASIFAAAIEHSGYTTAQISAKAREPKDFVESTNAFGITTPAKIKRRNPVDPHTFTDRYGATLTIKRASNYRISLTISSPLIDESGRHKESIAALIPDTALVYLFDVVQACLPQSPAELAAASIKSGLLVPTGNRAARRAKKKRSR